MSNNDRLTMLARAGFAARGLVYVLIGWFALDVALHGGKPIDNQGALGTLADAPFGQFLIGICALGFAGYALWRLTEAAIDPENRGEGMKGKFERLAYAFSGIAYAFLAVAAGQLALKQAFARHGSPGDESAQSWSAWLLNQPGGDILLILAGGIMFVIAGAQASKAYKGRFDELNGDVPAPNYVRMVGRAGYSARALIFGIIGWFLISAALNHDAGQAGGLGEALRELRGKEGGGLILGVVAIGLGLFGTFSMIEARYRRIRLTTPEFMR